MQAETDEMTVRKADKKDIAQIQQIAELAWRPTYLAIIGEEQCAFMLEWMYNNKTLEEQMDNGMHFFIAENDDQEAIGFAAFEQIDLNKGKLHKLYTHLLKKEKGTGSILLESIKNLAKSMGLSLIELNVNRKNSAFEFYCKKGFKVVEEVDVSIGNGYFMNDFIMQLDLHN